MIPSTNKKNCQNYLGNRGICEDVKKCAYYDGVWFIVFAHAPEDVEVSKACSCYECCDIHSAKGFAWTPANFKKIKAGLDNL